MNQDNQNCGNLTSCGQYVDNCNACCCCAAEESNPCNRHASKLEPANLQQYICGPKACSIFGGHDNYYPEDELCSSPRSKHKSFNVNTLGSPVGLVTSSFILKTLETKGSELHAQRFATYLKAFAKIYTTSNHEWNTEIIDQLLKEGQQLFTDSKAGLDENDDTSTLIYSEAEAKIKRTFDLDGSNFHLELTEKFELRPSPVERSGDEIIPDLTLEFLRPTIKSFFRHGKYCLLKLNNWYILVWKSRGVFFVFDFYGRRLNDFLTDRETGVAMLICLKTLDNVCHLVLNLSGLQSTDMFSIREMKVTKLTGPDGKTVSRDYGKRQNQFEVISAEYAYLKALLHLSLKQRDPLRSRSALPVAVAALLASKIDHPATWNQKVLDKLICYGANICRCCWEQCLKSGEPIDLDRFPNELKLGQFLTRFSLTPMKYEGIWKCVPLYKESELALAIEKAFASSDNHLLIQLDQQIYAVWKKNNFIYLFDPYRHSIQGTSSSGGAAKSATLRMFRSLETFLSVFNQILLESNRTTTFYIHTLQIKSIDLAANVEGKPALDGAAIEGDFDVKSLNENICFDEDEMKCKAELGEISEDDDITSGIVELEEKEPKSESDEDEDMEEEEGGAEGLGGEYESSSSGDDDPNSMRKKKKGKKGGKDKKKTDKGGDKAKKDKKGKGKNKKQEQDKEKTKKDKSKEGKKRKGKKGKGDSDDDSDSDKKAKKKKKTKDDDGDDSKKKKDGDKSEDARGKSDDARKKSDGSVLDKDPNKTTDMDKYGRGDDGGRGGRGTFDGDRPSSSRDQRDQRDGRDGRDKDEYDHSKDDTEDGDTERYTCKPNNYPGYSNVARDMAVVGSESGTYESICKLLRAGFKCADRILIMTPWGKYVVFRGYKNIFKKIYFLFDGCTCNVNRFRHLDLNCGTAGLLCFQSLHDVICYIIDSHQIRTSLCKSRKNMIDEICRQYC